MMHQNVHQGWVGGRLRLPEAGLLAKMPASRPASVSKHSKVAGFGLGFGFLKCCFWWIRLRLRLCNIFMAGFGFPEFCIWLPRFNRHFIHKPRLDFYLSAGTLIASIRSSRHLCLSCASRKTVHFQCGWKGFLSRKKYPLSRVFETLIVIHCNGGDV